jgi:arsenate reductase
MLKVYAYEKCSTCREALGFLKKKNIPFQLVEIRKTPPKLKELESLLKASGDHLKKLFNTSGMDYRAQELGEKLPNMSAREALGLLSKNGNLVKRPVAIDGSRGIFLVGFDTVKWTEKLK